MIHTNNFPKDDLRLERSGGTLVRRKGIYIAQLHGSYEAMGRQHGELAAAVCGDVVPRYMNDLIMKLVAHAVPSVARLAAFLLKEFFRLRNRNALGEELRVHLKGLADALEFKPVDAERVFFMADILHYAAGKSLASLAPAPACSAVFACDDATKDGKLIVGRNFDFFGRNVWNDNNAIIVMHPKDRQRFCWLGALGASASGQGFNENGLFVGLHTKFTRDLSTKGVPIFKIVHDVLAECTTLDEAITCITKKPRMCGLSLFVVDSRARNAAAVGFSARHVEVVAPVDDVLVRANHYTTPDMQSREAGPHPWRENSYGRFDRLTEILSEKRGTLSLEDMPAILSDAVDPFEQRKRVVGSIVACINNAQSIIMSPDDDGLYMNHGDYPVCHGKTYNGFRISALLEGDEEAYAMDDLPGVQQFNEDERAALYEYEQAWTAYMDNLDSSKTIFHLLRGAELLPEEVAFPRMAGMLLLKEKKYERALPLLVRNTEYEYRNTLMHAEAHLWLGRCLDLLGRRQEALEQYDVAVKLDAPPVSTAAARHKDKLFKAYQLFNVSPELIVGTVLAKY